MLHIAIRVDASVEIGTGHMMRCLTLAERLRTNHMNVVFISREHDGHMCDFIASKGFEVIRLKNPASCKIEAGNGETQTKHSKWLGVTQWMDAQETLRELQARPKLDLLIVDHYGLDVYWESIVRGHARKLLVIDDLADRHHDCDMLLDQNFYINMEGRYRDLVPRHCKLLLGPSYALLRDEFAKARTNMRKRDGKVHRIMIFFGGSDPTNETMKAINAIKSLKVNGLTVDIIVGAINPHKDSLKRVAEQSENFNYYCQVTNMAEMMNRADLAIGAGGSTTWERCYLGLPAITVTIAENQREVNAAVHEYGAIYNLGNHMDISELDIAKAVRKILTSPETLQDMSAKGLRMMGDVVGGNLIISELSNILEDKN